jgi:modulator of FtsH protease
MGYVAVTVGSAALGAYPGRDLSGGVGLLLFVASFAVLIGLNVAVCRRREQLVAGATAGFIAAIGAYGYATRGDLSSWARPPFRALSASSRPG